LTPRRTDLGRRKAYNAKVYDLVRRIPRGRVTTYGAIAARIHCPSWIDPLAYRRIRARWVGYAMACAPEKIPWQRVINAAGRTSARPGFGVPWQRARLRQEGIRFLKDGRIDLGRYGWTPRFRSSDRER
jgi:methylated-DNA-protein-cysteine methyltransferase-like protein